MDLRTLCNQHRIQQKHLREFADSMNLSVNHSTISRIFNGHIRPSERVRRIMTMALLSFGVSQNEIDALPELKS